MTDKAPERIWAKATAIDVRTNKKLGGDWWECPTVTPVHTEYIRADIHQALEAERDELAAALDSEHAVVGSSIWRFWSKKACETADRNLELIAERDRLREALERIKSASDYYADPPKWVGDDTTKYAHESTFRLAVVALEGKQ